LIVALFGVDGFGVITTYSETTDVTDVSVTDNIIEPLTTEGGRAFYVNPGVLNFTFQRNQITGKFGGRALAQAKNGLVEDNSIDGQGLGGRGLGSWGYPDADVWGHTTFRHNVFSGLTLGLSIIESNDVVAECNRFEENDTAVVILDNFGATNFDPTTIDLHTNSFLDSSTNGLDNSAITPGAVLAENNWWGCVAGPGNPGCDSVSGSADYTSFATSVPGCVSCSDDSQCGDGVACNGAETCNLLNSMCQSGTPVNCAPFADQCNDAACTEPSGTCVVTPKIDGFGCNDGDLCTSNDICQSGVCVGAGGSGDADNDGYCDLQENQAGCNPNDGKEIPVQPNVYSGGRLSRGGEVLLTYYAPADRTIHVGTDPSCATSGTCNLVSGFCTAGQVSDPCTTNADCNQPANTCRVVVNYAATPNLTLLKAFYKVRGTPKQDVLMSMFSPAKPGCSRKLDFVLPVNFKRAVWRVKASGTTGGKLRRDRDRVIYKP